MVLKSKNALLKGVVTLAVFSCFVGFPLVSAEEAADGQALFVSSKCNMCHSVPQVEIVAMITSKKMQGPDMPAAPREPEWIASFLKREIQLNDKDHKKEFGGAESDLKTISTWLSELKPLE